MASRLFLVLARLAFAVYLTLTSALVPAMAACVFKNSAAHFDKTSGQSWRCRSPADCPDPDSIGAGGWRNRADHWLVGKAIALRANGAIDWIDSIDAMMWRLHENLTQDRAIVLLGEAHDNTDHHDLEGMLVDCFKTAKTRAVVLEQIRADQQAGLDRFREFEINARRLATVAEFKQFFDWEKSGWAKYDYDPLLEAIIAAKLPVIPGDPPRDTIKKLAKEGPSALSAEEQQRLFLDKPLGDALDAASAAEIEDAHCGMLPKLILPNMAFAQRYRDAHLADATLKAAEAHGSAILITGNIHARTDRGVPWYIRSRAPDKKVVSVMLIEVEDGKTDPEAYVPRDPDGKPAADYIVFTPAAKHDNLCAEMTEKAPKTPNP